MQAEWTRRRFAACGSLTSLYGATLAAAPAWSLPSRTLLSLQKAIAPHLAGRRGGMALLHIATRTLIVPAGEEALCRMLLKPGSTVKPFLLWQLLRSGLVSERSEHLCRGALRIADRQLDCSHATQPGTLAAAEALALSCNGFFAHFAKRLNGPDFGRTLREYGVDARHVFARECAPSSVGLPASPDDVVLQALGEAHVVTTPLAMLAAFVRLLERMVQTQASMESRILQSGMRGCVDYGTGVEAAVKGLALAGKTGTGTSADRSFLNGWFLSYAPAEAPLLAMLTFVENGRGGAEAAPVAGAAWRELAESHALG